MPDQGTSDRLRGRPRPSHEAATLGPPTRVRTAYPNRLPVRDPVSTLWTPHTPTRGLRSSTVRGDPSLGHHLSDLGTLSTPGSDSRRHRPGVTVGGASRTVNGDPQRTVSLHLRWLVPRLRSHPVDTTPGFGQSDRTVPRRLRSGLRVGRGGVTLGSH